MADRVEIQARAKELLDKHTEEFVVDMLMEEFLISRWDAEEIIDEVR